MPTPLHRLPDLERYATALQYVGRQVSIYYNPLRQRSNLHRHTGELVSVARSELGTGTQLAILRIPTLSGTTDVAISLAWVDSIEAR